MAKTSTIFVCSNCGNEATKWFGKCPACNEWNTCYEEKTSKSRMAVYATGHRIYTEKTQTYHVLSIK